MPQLAVLARATSSIMQGWPRADCSRSILDRLRAAAVWQHDDEFIARQAPGNVARAQLTWMRWATLPSGLSLPGRVKSPADR